MPASFVLTSLHAQASKVLHTSASHYPLPPSPVRLCTCKVQNAFAFNVSGLSLAQERTKHTSRVHGAEKRRDKQLYFYHIQTARAEACLRRITLSIGYQVAVPPLQEDTGRMAPSPAASTYDRCFAWRRKFPNRSRGKQKARIAKFRSFE